MEYTTKDSGEREEFPSGARRDIRRGKGRFDLVPPGGIARVAGVAERGAEKYGEKNYTKGMPTSRFIDSALRHINQHVRGQVDEDHLGQAAWNLLAALDIEELVKEGLSSDFLSYSTGDLDDV